MTTTETTSVTLNHVLRAEKEIRPFVHRTPAVTSRTADEIASTPDISFRLIMKCENLQKIGAFKIRGATNAVRSLLRDCPASNLTVVTHSSGNHAQALALAASKFDVRACVVMPRTASPVKKAAVQGYGGIVTECEPTLQAREETAKKVVEKELSQEPQRRVEFIPPYDDARIIAGQGTIAVELLEQAREAGRPLDVIIAPVGGGGMLSGIAIATKGLSSDTWVVAAEPAGADDAFRSFNSGTFQPSVDPKTIADGLLTSTGRITFPLILKYVDAIYTVSDEQIIRTMKLVFERMKLVVEPSAVVSLAVALFSEDFKRSMKERYDQKGAPLNIGVVFSGGNVDLSTISKLFEQISI